MPKAVLFDMYETLITLLVEPKCFGFHIAELAGIPNEVFQKHWKGTEEDRMTGRVTFEENIKENLMGHGVYTDELYARVMDLRIKSRTVPFDHMHPEIIPMLQGIKDKGIRIGLISNCSSEEAALIKKSILFQYFDVPIMSSDVGLQKPDEGIFRLAMARLGVNPEDCFYVGDGGSRELEAAGCVGMTPMQACWYLKPGSTQQVTERKEGFLHLDTPLSLLSMC